MNPKFSIRSVSKEKTRLANFGKNVRQSGESFLGIVHQWRDAVVIHVPGLDWPQHEFYVLPVAPVSEIQHLTERLI